MWVKNCGVKCDLQQNKFPCKTASNSHYEKLVTQRYAKKVLSHEESITYKTISTT
jgi:hypothetical protein